MRLNFLMVPAAAALVVAGCAPESMVTQAVPAQHAPPSAITPTTSPTPSASVDEAVAEAESAPRDAMVQMKVEESPTPEPVVTPTSAAPTTAEATVEAQDGPTPSAQATSVKPSPSPVTSRPAATVTPTAPAAGSQWRDVNLDNLTYSDADRLTAVSPSFRDYAVQAMSAADTDGCTVLGLSVLSVHPAGYVVGSVSTDCGGGQAIWAENGDEQWKVAMVLQAPPLCTELMEIGLPAGVGLLCDDGAAELSEY